MTEKEKNIDSINSMPFPRISKLNKAQVIGTYKFAHGVVGDLRYRAPEVIQGKAYSFKADCWSFGVILYFLLTKKHPFDYGEELI